MATNFRRVQAFCVGLLLIQACASSERSSGQQMAGVSQAQEAITIHAYRSLFRRTVSYKQQDDSAARLNQSSPSLLKAQAGTLGLSDFDNATLIRLAQAYQLELKPIRARIRLLVQQFRGQFPGHRISAGADHAPPEELNTLQQEDDSVTKRYRALLQNNMRTEDFTYTEARILKSLDVSH